MSDQDQYTRVKFDIGPAIFSVEARLAELSTSKKIDPEVKAIVVTLLEINRELHLRQTELEKHIQSVVEAIQHKPIDLARF